MGYIPPPIWLLQQEPSAPMEIGDGCITFLGKVIAWLVFLGLIAIAIASLWIK